MLQRSLTELAVEALFSSEGLSNELKAALVTPDVALDDDGFAQRCRQALVRDLDRNHARRFRLNDLERAFQTWWPARFFGTGKLPLLDNIFGQVMMRNGDFLQYRAEQVQAYARLAAGVEPTLLAGWHLAGWMHAEDLMAPHNAERIVKNQLPFFAPPPMAGKPYAEGHVHLGGVHFDGLILLGKLTSEPQPGKPDQFTQLSALCAALIDCATLLDGGIDQVRFRKSCHGILAPGASAELAAMPDWALLFKARKFANEIGMSWLLAQLAQAMIDGDLGLAWRWLVVWLWYSYQHPATTEYVRLAIYYLFANLMQVRRAAIMDGLGLSRFTRDYYRNPLRKGEPGAALNDSVRRLFVGKLDLVEIKVEPDAFTPDGVAKLAGTLAKHSGAGDPDSGLPLSDVASAAYIGQMERWHFCAHFLRRKDFIINREALWIKADQFVESLQLEAGWNLPEFLNGHLNQHYRFHPARWLRGLDIAGDENAVRSEVFAPVLRWLRRGFLQRPFGESASAGFHLSIHAGEDYAHPLSGMRHVDETVRFCGMRSGDRIGHGLALGIDPAEWVQRQGDMILPVDEHLDNLVWAWHYACKLSATLPLASQLVPSLERRIARFVYSVSWLKDSGFAAQAAQTPDILLRAWKLRRNCHTQFGMNPASDYDDPKLKEAVPDFTRLQQACDNKSNAWGAERAYFLRESEVAARKSADAVETCVLIRQPGSSMHGSSAEQDGLLVDVETPENLAFMHAVQDYLLDKYDRDGLIIEANPSSNIYIGRFESHREHPIFRWYPPDESCLREGQPWNRYGMRRGPIKVLVNTDDPGIMPTTLRTEFALLGEAAIELGYSRTNVDAWLERLRQFGLDEFGRNHLPIFERQ